VRVAVSAADVDMSGIGDIGSHVSKMGSDARCPNVDGRGEWNLLDGNTAGRASPRLTNNNKEKQP
jgi:hypothetical protein